MALRSKLPNLLENVARCMALSPQDTVDEEDDFVNLHESSYATRMHLVVPTAIRKVKLLLMDSLLFLLFHAEGLAQILT
ncbi:hypothetical protein PDE_01340 [Penicillium oxalicum 114-2]|uniref:Uncharacterized protein n=1 Tax=Penicillium oxalicum (strain 114-2 / CGMCC 5302) TaxID=933388 RepID=S7Z896_PENO1|nr:hypothetical protein PDE_01340 [Penicillium oxalicum 114-2]